MLLGQIALLITITRSLGLLVNTMTRPQGDLFGPSGYLDECEDLLLTHPFKLWLFRLNGWPALPCPASEQAWKPWHRWYGRRDR